MLVHCWCNYSWCNYSWYSIAGATIAGRSTAHATAGATIVGATTARATIAGVAAAVVVANGMVAPRRVTCDPGFALLRIHSEHQGLRDICTPTFAAELFTAARREKEPKCPSTDERTDKMRSIWVMGAASALARRGL